MEAIVTMGSCRALSRNGICCAFKCAHCLAFVLRPVKRATSSLLRNIVCLLKVVLSVLFNKGRLFKWRMCMENKQYWPTNNLPQVLRGQENGASDYLWIGIIKVLLLIWR